MHLEQLSIGGEVFIGLFGIATDKYAILSRSFPDTTVLDVPILRTNIYGTGLIGMFCVGNSKALLIPHFTSDDEVEAISDFFTENNIDTEIYKIRDIYNALGNLIVCNDNGCVVSPKLKKHNFEDILGVECVVSEISAHEEVGSCCFATNRGFLCHPMAEGEIKFISDVLRVDGKVGTVNMGYPFVHSGLVANSKGYATGMRTTGIELGRIDEALNFW